MAGPPKILVFAGSAHAGALNKKLARMAVRAVRDAGGEGGALKDARQQATLAGIARRLVDVTTRPA